MSLFRSRAKEKEYNLWHDWHVNLLGDFEHVKNDGSGQLVNKDGSRVIYGSSFTIHGMTDVKDEVSFLGTKQDEEGEGEGDYHLSASVSQNNEILAINITYRVPSDEEWATAVINSAHRIQFGFKG